jgi:hypothetical protein
VQPFGFMWIFNGPLESSSVPVGLFEALYYIQHMRNAFCNKKPAKKYFFFFLKISVTK